MSWFLIREFLIYEPALHRNGEYYLASAVGVLIQHHRVMAVTATKGWIDINTPEDLEGASQIVGGQAGDGGKREENQALLDYYALLGVLPDATHGDGTEVLVRVPYC